MLRPLSKKDVSSMNKPLHNSGGRGASSRLTGGDDRFQIIFDAVNDGIFISDPSTGRFIEVNEPGCRMFGYKRAELIGRDIVTLSSGVYPYTQERAIEQLQKAAWKAHKRSNGTAKPRMESCFGLRSRSALPSLAKFLPSWPSCAISMSGNERLIRLREAQSALVEAQAVAHVGSFSGRFAE